MSTSYRPTVMERAYELARSGTCASVSEIRAKLSGEGYYDVAAQIYGPSLTSDLRKLCNAARPAAPPVAA